MFSLNKKSGFTLAEIMVTLALVGGISAMVIPSLAYNYKGKVLEQQFRDTYSEVKQIGSMINYEKGDVGEYANKISYTQWAKEFMSRITGGNALCAANVCNSSTSTTPVKFKRDFYKKAGTNPGPYLFHLNAAGKKVASNDICDNAGVWTDSKGRIWTFNAESRIICVDINGTANPNRINIDTFAFMPLTAEQTGAFIYLDTDNPKNYSGQFAVCDLAKLATLSNTPPTRDAHGKYVVNREHPQVAYDTCPFNEPLENIAPAGLSAKNRPVTTNNTYWKDYIDYK